MLAVFNQALLFQVFPIWFLKGVSESFPLQWSQTDKSDFSQCLGKPSSCFHYEKMMRSKFQICSAASYLETLIPLNFKCSFCCQEGGHKPRRQGWEWRDTTLQMTIVRNWAVYQESWEANNTEHFWWSLRLAWIKFIFCSSFGQATPGHTAPYRKLPQGPCYGTSAAMWPGLCYGLRHLCVLLRLCVGLFAGCPLSQAFTSGVS